jgi:hypothetical protein
MLQHAEDQAELDAAAAAGVSVSPLQDSAAAFEISSSTSAAAAAAAAAADSAGDPLQQLDWESIIDSPHGSLRLLGSCKAPWMDKDPAWVTEKSYSEVQLVDGVWMRQPLSYAAVQQCSILLGAMELRVFEQSHDFLEAVYQVRLQLQMEVCWSSLCLNQPRSREQNMLACSSRYFSSFQQQQGLHIVCSSSSNSNSNKKGVDMLDAIKL